MLWVEEQRAIGELMMLERDEGLPQLREYASFVSEYRQVFKQWLDRFGPRSAREARDDE
jgi:hypothetical protein